MKHKRIFIGIIAMLFAVITSKGQSNAVEQKTVQIGTQIWMAENLNVTKYRNGDVIPEVEDVDKFSSMTTGAWCYNIRDEKKTTKYYNWYAVVDPRGLAPEGWKIPTAAEWDVMINFLGGGIAACPKLKSDNNWADVSLQGEPAGNGNNSSGFNAKPTGVRSGQDAYFKSVSAWWCSDLDNIKGYKPDARKYMKMTGNKVGGIGLDIDLKSCGFAVRCIKGEGVIKSTANNNTQQTETPTKKTETLVASYHEAFWAPDDAHPSVNFKKDDGSFAMLYLSESLFGDKTFIAETNDIEIKTNKSIVGKKFKIIYETKNNVQGVLGEIISYEEFKIEPNAVKKAKIGLVNFDIDDYFMKEKNLPNKNGVLVDKVVNGGAGFEAGILSGDVILAIDNESFVGTSKLAEIISKHQPGDKIEMKILRNGKEINKSVLLK